MGPSTVASLQGGGHQVAVFHRGKTLMPAGAEEIKGDHHHLADYRPEFARRNFDVVVDFILSSGRQAQTLMELFRGITGRVVALSSMDVYRAMGLIHGSETGPLQQLPLTEESALRLSGVTYSGTLSLGGRRV